MKLAIVLGFALVGLAFSSPTTKHSSNALIINDDFFPEDFKIYEGQHDIIRIYVPLNNLNFDESPDSDEDSTPTIFFVEGDIDKSEDYGLYIRKGNQVTKLLDHGRDITAPTDEESKVAYFATKDGIYVYNAEENKAEKFGQIEEDLFRIVMINSTQNMYVLSSDKKVYKVSEDGNKLTQIDEIKDAEQIVLDFGNNLYYVDSEKDIYIVNADGVKKVQGLPEHTKITLLNPPFIYDQGGIPVVVDDRKTYTLYGNGTLDEEDIVIDTKITAYSVDATILQYYAHDKKIYEYNFLIAILTEVLEGLKEFIDNLKIDVEDIGSKRKSSFRSRA